MNCELWDWNQDQGDLIKEISLKKQYARKIVKGITVMRQAGKRQAVECLRGKCPKDWTPKHVES